MKVSILGAGAIGSMLGGLLKHDAPDLEVVLVTRGDHARAIQRRGEIVLDGPWGTRHVSIACSAEVSAVSDSKFILITVKSQDTVEAARMAAPFVGDATVVSIQNGINDHRLATHLDPRQLVMGMTATNMALVEPGRVSLQLGGATVLGSPEHENNRQLVYNSRDLLRRIKSPQLSFEAHENVTGVRYNKLAVNALGYASCLSASNFISRALADPKWREAVGLPIVRECQVVFDQAGIDLDRIPGVPSLARLERFMRLMGTAVVGPMITYVARRLFDRKPIVFSLQQDLARSKPTEVAYVNGEIVRLAESTGVPAPANGLVVDLVRELEQRADGTFFAQNEVIRRFLELRADRTAA